MIRCLNCMKEYEEKYQICPHCGFIRGTQPKEIYHLHPGVILQNRYVIGTVLGTGGFGITYRAWDRTLNLMVAIKEYYPSGVVNRNPGEQKVIVYTGRRAEEFKKGLLRFLEEARNSAKFNTHPNIVHVFDFFEENNTAYFVMEFLDGISMKEYIKAAGGKLPLDTAVQITVAVGDGLKALHKHNIIHRDLSPDNIFICKDGRIKVIDLGAARFSNGEEEKTLSIILKPGFAPPEQYRSRSKQGPWTDIYALGATLYRAVTGQMPEESVNRAVEDNLIRPGVIDATIPEYIEKTILKAMAILPELRFRKIEEFQEALLQKRNVLEVTEELKKRKKRRFITGAIAAVAVIALLFGSGKLYHDRQTQNILDPAEITIWIPVKDGDVAATEECFDKMLAEFRENNEQITLHTEYIEVDVYAEKLAEAAEIGQLPTLFDNSVGTVADEDCAILKDVWKEIEGNDLYFLQDYQEFFPGQRKMPLGFSIPMICTNTNLLELAVADQQTDVSLDMSVQEKLSWLNEKEYADDQQIEEFLDGKSMFLLTDTTKYYSIQETLAGIYQIEGVGEENQTGIFTDLWSVAALATKEEQKAAERVLYYFLSDTGQDTYHIQYQNAFPLDRSEMETYLMVYGEMEWIVEELEKVTDMLSKINK